jgi:hypothetical protein
VSEPRSPLPPSSGKPPPSSRGEGDAHLPLDRKSASGESLRLYLSETEPSGIEKRTLVRWLLLAFAALILHLLFFWVMPRLSRPIPPPPIEIQQVDPAKLQAIKNRWKERGFLLSKDPNRAKDQTPPPKNARYESDRNRTVEKETRARQTNVIPNQAGNPKSADTTDQTAQKKNAAPKNARQIPLSNLSNFRSLPAPMRPESERPAKERRGGPGDTGDQALNDDSVPLGAENMLNTVESVYYSFYARIYEQIGPLWQSRVRDVVYRKRLPAGDYITRVDVVFDPDGNFLEARLLDSSGVPELDQVVSAAWAQLPRFPNPPRALIQPDGKIHTGWGFNVRIDPNMNWNYLPPQRAY